MTLLFSRTLRAVNASSGSPERTGPTWIEGRRPVLQDLIARPADCYRLTLDREGTVVGTQVAPSDLMGLMELLSRHKPYDSAFQMNGEWVDFWRGRTASRASTLFEPALAAGVRHRE